MPLRRAERDAESTCESLSEPLLDRVQPLRRVTSSFVTPAPPLLSIALVSSRSLGGGELSCGLQ